MHLPSYTILEKASDNSVFRFLSTGPNGIIPKLIIFTEYNPADNIYNLALVDEISNDEYSDTTLSNNNDIRRILATVAKTLMEYTLMYPARKIYFKGSDEEGKRIGVYNEAVRKYHYLLTTNFKIEGYIDDLNKEEYNPVRSYGAFLVKRK